MYLTNTLMLASESFSVENLSGDVISDFAFKPALKCAVRVGRATPDQSTGPVVLQARVRRL